jgi:PAS domain-containing protein
MIYPVNDAYLASLGFRREEVIGRSTLSLGIYPDPEQRRRLIGGRMKIRSAPGKGSTFFVVVTADETAGQLSGQARKSKGGPTRIMPASACTDRQAPDRAAGAGRASQRGRGTRSCGREGLTVSGLKNAL